MTTAKPPSNRAHLFKLLTDWSKQPGAQEVGRLQRLVGVIVIAAMLDGLKDSDGEERIAYKGGSALILRFGDRARGSKDLDAAFRGDVEEALTLIGGALERGWNGFDGRLGEAEEILRPGITPPPVRVRVRLNYKRQHLLSVPLEISPAEGRSLEEIDQVEPALSLAAVHLPDPRPIGLLPVPYQIAQKLHACTEPETDERPNIRAHDVHDLLLIRELVPDLPLGIVRAACVEIFEGRGKQAWPPQLVAPPGWALLWKRLQEEEGSPYSLDEAVELLNGLVQDIEATAPVRAVHNPL